MAKFFSCSRETETSMLEEANRHQTFASCPVNKHWPPVEELARCGFYWIPKLEQMQCFSCKLVINSWDSPDQDVALKHRLFLVNLQKLKFWFHVFRKSTSKEPFGFRNYGNALNK